MSIVKLAENEKAVLKVMYDEMGESPREWDNMGTMVCFHRKYNLGDEHDYYDHRDFLEYLAEGFITDDDIDVEEMSTDELMDIINDNAVILPLFLYDHSGITMSTSMFNCPWDSGQVGWIYVTHDDIIKEYGSLDIEEAKKVLQAEVEEYDKYLRGDVYGFILEDKNGEVIESCWGFYGMEQLESELKNNLPDEYVGLVDQLEYTFTL